MFLIATKTLAFAREANTIIRIANRPVALIHVELG